MIHLLLRRTYDAAALWREHPPRVQHAHKAALMEMAYSDGAAPAGQIEVTRWRQQTPDTIQLPPTLASEVRPDFYDYRRVASHDAIEWHVNFADPRLFVAYGSPLFAQDEMQVAEHPLLASVREALVAEGLPVRTSDETGATPILVHNVERRLAIDTGPNAAAGRPAGLYGNRFAAAPWEAVRQATRRIDPPTQSHIIAMAAPAGGTGEYSDGEIMFTFTTAYTAFVAAAGETRRIGGPSCMTIIHSGFWGCGAFGGNRRLMIALQSLAARAAGVQQLILHAGDANGAEEAAGGLDVADGLALRCGATCSPNTLVARTAMLGYRWGVSDGN